MSQGTDKASAILGTAAASSAAIPVAGPFVAAGLGVASFFTKIFGNIEGPRKRRRARARRTRQYNQNLNSQTGFQQGPGGFLNTGSQMPGQGQAPLTNQIPPQGYFFGGDQ